MRIIAFIVGILLFCEAGHARVFNLYDQSLGAYFRGNFGNSNVQQDAFLKTSGSQTNFDKKVNYNDALELGFVFPNPAFSLLVGFQVINPQKLTAIDGKKSDGTSLMTVDSNIYGFFPVARFEYYLMKTPGSRMTISAGGGYGKVIAKNNYNMTSAGTTLYSTSSFDNSVSQNTFLAETAVGYEFTFGQNVTALFDVGYRYAVAHNLKYDSDSPNFAGGTHAEGSDAVDTNGNAEKIDLSGFYGGFAFRFYFNY
jgi:hypothetical protein